MAPPANRTARPNALAGSLEQELRTQVNNLTASLRLITAKLDLDAGVTDANYDALVTATAIATAPAVIDVPGF
jgi:hypothetical protein